MKDGVPTTHLSGILIVETVAHDDERKARNDVDVLAIVPARLYP
jgi:hypothetical protein